MVAFIVIFIQFSLSAAIEKTQLNIIKKKILSISVSAERVQAQKLGCNKLMGNFFGFELLITNIQHTLSS